MKKFSKHKNKTKPKMLDKYIKIENPPIKCVWCKLKESQKFQYQ